MIEVMITGSIIVLLGVLYLFVRLIIYIAKDLGAEIALLKWRRQQLKARNEETPWFHLGMLKGFVLCFGLSAFMFVVLYVLLNLIVAVCFTGIFLFSTLMLAWWRVIRFMYLRRRSTGKVNAKPDNNYHGTLDHQEYEDDDDFFEPWEYRGSTSFSTTPGPDLISLH